MFGGLSAWATARAQPVPPNLAGAPPALLEYAGRALAELIDESRQHAIADGVRPLPSGIYRSLLGYFPATLLQNTRFADGCIRPLSLPALGALAIFTFVAQWNNFLWPLITTSSPDMQVTTVALASLQGQFNTDWPLLMTGSVLAIVPMLVVFALGNRSFISGITTGGFGGR